MNCVLVSSDDCKLIWFCESSLQLLSKKIAADARDADSGGGMGARCGIEFDEIRDLRRFGDVVGELLQQVYQADDEHHAKNERIRDYVGKWTEIAKTHRVNFECSATESASSPAFRSTMGAKVVSTDDMSAVQGGLVRAPLRCVLCQNLRAHILQTPVV